MLRLTEMVREKSEEVARDAADNANGLTVEFAAANAAEEATEEA